MANEAFSDIRKQGVKLKVYVIVFKDASIEDCLAQELKKYLKDFLCSKNYDFTPYLSKNNPFRLFSENKISYDKLEEWTSRWL